MRRLAHKARLSLNALLFLQLRVLVILRDPISRAYSHWQHELRRGKQVPTTFADAVRSELQVTMAVGQVGLMPDCMLMGTALYCYFLPG